LGWVGAAKQRDKPPKLTTKNTRTNKTPKEMKRRRAPVGRDGFDAGGDWIKQRLLRDARSRQTISANSLKIKCRLGRKDPKEHPQKSQAGLDEESNLQLETAKLRPKLRSCGGTK
jgi:hypothetical protein